MTKDIMGEEAYQKYMNTKRPWFNGCVISFVSLELLANFAMTKDNLWNLDFFGGCSMVLLTLYAGIYLTADLMIWLEKKEI